MSLGARLYRVGYWAALALILYGAFIYATRTV